MSDEVDLASDLEIAATERALRQHADRKFPDPDFNDKGEKLCVDCADVIPKARAVLPFAVRCIECQTIYERE